nr:beta-hexosaminidase 3 [Ipomoea batatas]GME18842.1 beta-hexosaminidase 3 [Ipomoea batatas]
MMVVAADLLGKTAFWGIGFCLIVVSAAAAGASNGGANERLNIWPMPKSVSHGHHSLYLSDGFELKTDGSTYLDGSGILKDAFSRMVEVIRGTHAVDGNVVAGFNQSHVLKGVHVVVLSANEELQHGIDESYHLTVPDIGSSLYAYLRVGVTRFVAFVD